MKHILRFIKNQPPARLIVAGFFLIILTGACFLMLPVSLRPGVHTSFLDALFTATSATCVTGLVTVDPGDTYTVFGRVILALLIQTGGLGFTSMGAGLMLATKRRVGFKSRLLLKEALNVDNFRGIVRLLKAILLTTLIFETVGALLSFPVFVRDYPPLKALGISIFHSVSSFNNAGFDILGGGQSLIPYQNDILLNLVTGGLIIFGGLGFLVILDVLRNRSFRKLTLQSILYRTVAGAAFFNGSGNSGLNRNIQVSIDRENAIFGVVNDLIDRLPHDCLVMLGRRRAIMNRSRIAGAECQF